MFESLGERLAAALKKITGRGVLRPEDVDAGLREAVFEIQCHGYTHMLPDLESPPGPFWTAPMDGTGTLGFDVEFGDELRNKEVPAITQKFLLSRGIENIRKDFGVTPLFVINGGGAWSKTYPNNSPRIAAEMGFGLSNFGSPGYLGRDLVISPMEPVVQRTTWTYDRKLTGADIPWTMPSPTSPKIRVPPLSAC